ncbi:hypothetical protein FM21_16490 [Streptomyces mutabilis]|uniref:MFS transporter n=1 Tax=Streptomyces mutabilis TaxID=67332 RepID=A0A086MUE0_9ACTN|nr:hypothetical protein FM21_16490 [Streptomyces mutabilis]
MAGRGPEAFHADLVEGWREFRSRQWLMWATSVQTQVPPGVLNRIHAYDVAGSLAMMPVGQALAGPAASALGADHVLLVAGVTSFGVCAALLLIPAVRGLVRVDVAASASGRTAAAPEPSRAEKR